MSLKVPALDDIPDSIWNTHNINIELHCCKKFVRKVNSEIAHIDEKKGIGIMTFSIHGVEIKCCPFCKTQVKKVIRRCLVDDCNIWFFPEGKSGKKRIFCSHKCGHRHRTRNYRSKSEPISQGE